MPIEEIQTLPPTADLLERLHALTALLSTAHTAVQVARAIVEHGIAALGADAGAVLFLSADGEALEIAAAHGYSDALLAAWQRVPLAEPTPLTDAIRSGEPVWLETRADWERRYPTPTAEYDRGGVALPFVVEGAAVGGLTLSVPAYRAFSAEERLFLRTAAQISAQTLHRARLHDQAERELAERRAAEQALRESEGRLRVALTGSPITLYSQDSALRYTWMYNPSAGYAVENALGKTDAELLDAADAARLTTLKRRVIAGGEAERQEISVAGVAGPLIFDLHVEPVRDATGAVIGVTGAAFDITARRQAEEQQRFLTQIFERVEFGVIVTRHDDNTLMAVNPAFARMHGVTVEALVGRSLPDLCAPESHADLTDMLRRIEESGHEIIETIHQRADGSRFPALADVTALRDEQGMMRYRVAYVQDISARKQAEAALGERERQLRTVLANLPVGVWLTDAAGAILLDNPAGARIWGETYDGRDHAGAARGWWADTGEPIAPGDWSLDRALAHGESSYNELIEIEAADGVRKTILSSAVPIRDAAGQISGAVVVNEDISARRQAEAEQRASEARYRLVVETANEGVWLVDRAGRTILTNQSMAALLGCTIDEVMAGGVLDFVAADDRAPTLAHLELNFRGLNERFTGRFRRKDGSLVRVLAGSNPMRDAAGNVIGALGMFTDVTERVAAERALRRSEERLQLALDALDGYVYDADPVSGQVERSAGFTRVLGYAPNEAPPTTAWWAAQMHPDDAHIVGQATANRSAADTLSYEYRVRHKDGHYVWLWDRCLVQRDADGRPRRLVGSSVDISERKREEVERERLSESRAAILESAGEGIYGVDPAGRCIFMNSVALSVLGYSQAEVIGVDLHALIHHSHADGTEYPVEDCPFFHTVHSGAPTHQEEVLWRRDGTAVPVDYLARPLISQGRIAGSVIAFRDITERKRAEAERERLLANEQAARAAAEQATSRIARLQAVTAALSQAITPEQVAEVIVREGVAPLRAIRMTAILWQAPDDEQTLALLADAGYSAEMRQALARIPLASSLPAATVMRTGQPLRLNSLVERVAGAPTLAALGQQIGEGALTLLPLPVEERVIGVIAMHSAADYAFNEEEQEYLRTLAGQCAQALERTRLYVAERDARRAAQEALALRDVFVSSVTHDLKSPLATIAGAMQLLQRQAERNPTLDGRVVLRRVAMVGSATKSMLTMVNDLVDLSVMQSGRALELQRQPTDLVALVVEAAAAAQQAAHHVAIRVDAQVETLSGDWDRGRLARVMGNLLSNAVKYSPDGGRITLTLRREQGELGAQAVLTVTDEGMGIPAADLPRVFERFHRGANVVGQIPGTGFGLAGARQIVAQHGATIAAASVEGKGSTFTVRLPL